MSENQEKTIFSHKREKAPNQGTLPKVVVGIIVAFVVILVRTTTMHNDEPTTLSCYTYEEEVFSRVLEDQEATLVIPRAACWTPIVLIPKDQRFSTEADKCIQMLWEYEDGGKSDPFTYCPGMQFDPTKVARGIRFQNTGIATNGQKVIVTITPS